MGHEREWVVVRSTAASPSTAERPIDDSQRGLVPHPDPTISRCITPSQRLPGRQPGSLLEPLSRALRRGAQLA